MKRIKTGIVVWLIKTGEIDQSDSELYEYAIDSMFSLLFPLILTYCISLVMGIMLKGLLMIAPFMLIRKYSGSYHLKSAGTCFVFSCVLVITFLSAVKYGIADKSLNLLTTIATLIIIKKSPVDSENRRLLQEEINQYKKIARIMAGIFFLIYWILRLIKMNGYALSVGMGILLTTVLLIPCLFQKNC